MKRAALLGAVLVVFALPGPAAAEDLVVLMPGKHFEPPRSTIVAGDRVTWRNTDLVTHDVRVGGGVFDSGPLGRGAAWTQAFDQPGEYPFVCTLHAFMSGNLSVVPATLAAAPDGVLAGEPLTLSGRAPGAVTLERSTAGGPWEPIATAEGTFSVRTVAVAGAAYRAVTAAGTGAPVVPRVDAAVALHVRLTRGRLRVHAMPAPDGMVATLEVYDRWRYRWRTRSSVPLGRSGGAAFRVGARPRRLVRVSLRRRAGGPVLVRSAVLRASDGRRVRDPEAVVAPPVAEHH